MNKYTKKIFGFSFSSAKNNEDQTNNKGEDVNQQLISQLNKNKFPTWQQLKKLPKILNKQERLRISIVSIILILSVIGLGYNWFIEHSAISPTHGNSYSEGLLGSPNFINPAAENFSRFRKETKHNGHCDGGESLDEAI